MNFIATNLSGAYIIEPQVFADERGYFFESYHQAKFAQNGITTTFVQDNESRSTLGVMRGLHAQEGGFAQAKLIRVLSGPILDIGVDVRLDSPTFGQHVATELSADNRRMLYLPRGFLHGFAVLSSEAVVAYKCDNFWHKEAELTISLSDPDLALTWPFAPAQAIISKKDQHGINLRTWLKQQHLIPRYRPDLAS